MKLKYFENFTFASSKFFFLKTFSIFRLKTNTVQDFGGPTY